MTTPFHTAQHTKNGRQFLSNIEIDVYYNIYRVFRYYRCKPVHNTRNSEFHISAHIKRLSLITNNLDLSFCLLTTHLVFE